MEIKFRLWDVAKKEWHTGRDFLLDLDGDVLFNIGFGGLSKYDYACRDQIIYQYTGLKDKNNREVYEGDILHIKAEFGEYRGEVRFIRGSFQVCNRKDEAVFTLSALFNTNPSITECEVVGNIHEKTMGISLL